MSAQAVKFCTAHCATTYADTVGDGSDDPMGQGLTAEGCCAHCAAALPDPEPAAAEPHHTDAKLDQMERSGGGWARAAGYLRRVTDPAARDAIVGEATTQTNMTGGRWASAVGQQVELWLAGRFTGRYTGVNDQIIAAERANPGTIAYPEQFGVPAPRTT